MKLDPTTLQGHYARKQLLSPARIIAWSHAGRFRRGVELARATRARRLLDYGCGDGTFLAMLLGGEDRPDVAVGAEISPPVVEDCHRRLGALAGLSFTTIAELERPEHHAAYDAIVCMDVLEHVVDVDGVLATLEGLLAADGVLIVSVPVETGLPVLVKEAVRRLAGWRGIGDYPGTSAYTCREFLASLYPGGRQHVVRPVHQTALGPAHDHKGFNWRVLRGRISARFHLDRLATSPVRFLPPGLASQVWFIARRRSP